jgi:sugar (pentulose or hexulose) kinase
MKRAQHIAVIDIGKTNAKLALVDLNTLSEIAVVTRPNTVLPGPPWPHFDTEGHWDFLLDALTQFGRSYRIDGISITTHGASIVLLDEHGDLAAPILDYEHDGPQETAAAYDALRPTFERTGSPRLANGLNPGAQLHWQFHTDPGLLERTAHILTYPQYWSHRLTGVISSDVTSIGCHTDLWEPDRGQYSELTDRLGISDKLAPVHNSADILGPILPEISAATGLPPQTPVICGIHDSNASLYPHILALEPPFSVVSTGTWVIVMSMGIEQNELDPARDTLVNVNALGQPVPSARFMGGREFEMIQQGHKVNPTPQDISDVLEHMVMLLPSVDPSTGPFQGIEMAWHGGKPAVGSGVRAAALSYYLALMTNTCLELTGARGPVIVEGPFGQNQEYLAMLHAVTGRPVYRSEAQTGTSIGAALLFTTDAHVDAPVPSRMPRNASELRRYADTWARLTRAHCSCAV